MLISEILDALFPGTGMIFIDLDKRPDGLFSVGAGLETAISLRADKDLRPIIVVGFDSIDRVREHENGYALQLPGIFYLRVPCTFAELQNLTGEANKVNIPVETSLKKDALQPYALKKVRAFKHRCDNVWMAMKGNSASAQRALKSHPNSYPDALADFDPERIRNLIKEYKVIEPYARQLKMEKAEAVRMLLDKASNAAMLIKEGRISADEAVGESIRCADLIKEIAAILSKAGEVNNNA